ncbi:MAG: SLBB domain-containing protein [Chitinophagales bacterium]
MAFGVAAQGETGPYLLGAGDVLQISVWGHEDLTQVIQVRPDGQLSFPLVGELAVAGRTPVQVQEQLTAALSEYVKNPVVTVSVKEFRSIAVQVAGQVRAPGLYRLRPGATVADALAAAGGLAPEADATRVKLVSPEGDSSTLDLAGLLFRGDQVNNAVVGDGEQVIVQELPKVTVLGEVRTPGLYRLRPGATVADALASAGGLAPEADATRVKLVSSEGRSSVLDLEGLFLRGDQANNRTVADGDQIIVQALPKVTVLGEVRTPGLIPATAKDGLLEVLAKAGGATPDADLSRVQLSVYSAPALQPTTTVVDLTEAVRPTGDFALPQASRIVVAVPQKLRRVTVLGQVKNPGSYPVDDQSRLLDVLGAAGGPTDRAALESVRIYRGGQTDNPEKIVAGRDHLLFEGKSQEDPAVKPGDVVFIPETRKTNWTKVMTFLTGLNLFKDLFR